MKDERSSRWFWGSVDPPVLRRRISPVATSHPSTANNRSKKTIQQRNVRRQPLNSHQGANNTSTDEQSSAADDSSEWQADTESNESLTRVPVVRPIHSRWDNFKLRARWTVVLVAGFALVMCMGHFYCGLMVLMLTSAVYKELISLKRNAEKEEKLPLFFFQRWYWFCVTIFGTLYSYIIPFLSVLFGFQKPPHWVTWVVRSHTLVTYSAGLAGFVVFILSLRRFSLRYQFQQFSMLLLTCFLVVAQTAFQIKTIYNGLIWFFVPASLVIVNDISAYICGVSFGRTRLIKLSPNKTVEGFLGASVVTLLWALFITVLLSRQRMFICPELHMTLKPFAMITTPLDCNPNPVFLDRYLRLPNFLSTITGLPSSIVYKPAYLHSLALGLFAAFVAPFGGFFASAFKRALRIKDFAQYIPGHGGMTDRFDCQIIMGMFTFIYLRTFVLHDSNAIDDIIRNIVALAPPDRAVLFNALISNFTTLMSDDQLYEMKNVVYSL